MQKEVWSPFLLLAASSAEPAHCTPPAACARGRAAVGGAGPAHIFAGFIANAPAEPAPLTGLIAARPAPSPDTEPEAPDAPASGDAIGALLQRIGAGGE